MNLAETELIYLLKSEQRMGIYLEECEGESQKIDSRIWQIHASIPRKKQMSVLNSFIERIIAKQATIFSFLPKSMVRAKVYRTLQIPFSLNPVNDVVKVDVKSTDPKIVKKYKRFYNTLPSLIRRRGNINDVYEFTIDRLELCSFTEFRKQQQSQKRTEKSAAPNEFDFSVEFDVNQNSSIQPDREIVRVKSSKRDENVHKAKAISSTSNQKSTHHPDNEIQKPERTKKNKNRGITVTCTAQVHATEDEPVTPPAISRNRRTNIEIGAESGKNNLTTPIKTLSDSEKIRRIFTEIDSWDERLTTIDDTISFAENEIVSVPCHNDMFIESTAPEELAPEEPSTDIVVHVNKDTTIASQEKETNDAQNRNSDLETCESQMSKLFAEEVLSQSPSNCELDSRSAHASTSKIAVGPPLSITRTSSRFEKPVIEELSDLESVLEFGDQTAGSNMEKVSPEIEKLVRDVSAFRKTAAQKVPNLSDLAERPNDFEFHISSHEALSECSNDNLETTNSQLVSQDSEKSRILQSNENREVVEVLDTNLDKFVPPSAENVFEKSDSREHISNALVPDDDFQIEESSSNVHKRLSPADRHSDSPIVLPTPESECYFVSDSQPSQNREFASMPNEKPLKQEISSPSKNKIASQKQRRLKKSNSQAVDTPTSTKLQKNAASHSYHSDSDEELLFRANKKAPLKASKSTNCQPKPGKKSAVSASEIKKPAKISVETQSRSNNLTKYEKNVRKLTDFVNHKIMKNASTSKEKIESKAPCKSRSNEKRKLYTDTDDEVLLSVGKRRRKFKAKYTGETTSEADSALLPSISEASQESYKNIEPKSFHSVSEKMELLSLRASATRSSLTSPTRRVITVSPALFNTTSEKSTPKTTGSTSKSSYTPADVVTRNAAPSQKSSPPSGNETPEQLVCSNPNSRGSSNQTKVTRSEVDDNYWSRSSSPVSSNKRTMKYINESVKECLHLPRTPDSIPSQYLSAITSEKESDTSPPQVMRKHRRMQTLKQRNVKISYRLCLDSDSSSDDCYDLATAGSQKNDVLATNRMYKLYVPKEVMKRDQQRENSSQPRLSPIPNQLSDSDDRSDVDIIDVIIPPELCQNTETPVLTQVLEEPRPAQLSNSASSRHQGGGNVGSARKRIGFFTDDEYESDVLTVNLDDNLIRMQFPPETGITELVDNVVEDDEQSHTSFDYGDDIRQLMTEVDSLQKGQQDDQRPHQVETDLSSTSNEQELDVSVGSNYQEIMWNSYPDSLETALTTSEEKLKDTRETLKRQWENNKDVHQLYNPIAFLESSHESSDDNIFPSDLSD